MSLKDFGWETYRVRSHSIPPSLASTDTYQSAEKSISRTNISSSPNRSSLQVTSSLLSTKHNINESKTPDVTPSIRFNLSQNSNESDIKSKRSLTMPSTILLNTNEKTDILHGKH